MYKIIVQIVGEDIRETAVVPVDSLIFQRVAMPIDFPSPSADAFSKSLCSSDVTIKSVMKDREMLATEIASIVTQQLLDKLDARDTVMGYPVLRRNEDDTGID